MDQTLTRSTNKSLNSFYIYIPERGATIRTNCSLCVHPQFHSLPRAYGRKRKTKNAPIKPVPLSGNISEGTSTQRSQPSPLHVYPQIAETEQEAFKSKPDLDRRAIIVYGTPPSRDASSFSRVRHDISHLLKTNQGQFARLTAVATNVDSHPRPLKVTLKNELERELRHSRTKRLSSVAPLGFSSELISFRETKASCAERKRRFQNVYLTCTIRAHVACFLLRKTYYTFFLTVWWLALYIIFQGDLQSGRRRRGVALWVQSELFSRRHFLGFNNDSSFVEIISCHMPQPSQLLTILEVYRSPTSSGADEEQIKCADCRVSNLHICGDINAQHIN